MHQEYVRLIRTGFLRRVIFKRSCGRVRENTFDDVGFERLKSAHNFIESNTPLQAGASGFTMPSRAPTTDAGPLFWSS